MGTAEQRAKAVEDLATLKRGSRPAGVIANARAAAMAEALPGFDFENTRVDCPGLPRGHLTTELEFEAV